MFLDTSGLLCLHDRAERFHAKAREVYHLAARRLTHGYVLAEFVADLLDNPDIEVVWVDETLHRESVALLEARHDKTYSLGDAASFILMRRHGLQAALTTDRHFEQEGFQRLLV